MRKITIAFITLFILLLSIAPATATVSFIDLSAPSSASPGESFTISATAYDPSYSITAISMSSAKGKTSTYSCTPAHTCTQKFLITKYSAGAYTYTITSKNDIGQSASKTVTVNVKNPTINMPNLASVFSSSSSRSVYPAVSIPIQSSSDVSAAASTKVKFHWVMAAIDGPSMDNNDNLVYLNPSSVKINNVGTKSATPFTQFNVSADTRYDIFYSSNGYTTDGDVFLFDSRLPSCPVSGCDYTQGQSRTTCDYNATSDYFRCTVNNPNFGGPIAFDYYKNHPLYGANTVEVVNELFKPHCPIVYGMTNATFINGINYTGLDLDSYVYDDNTAKSDLIWTVTRQDNVSVSIGMSNIITVRALNSLFSGNDIIRFTASDGTCSDSDDLLVTVRPSGINPDINVSNLAIVSPAAGQNFTQNCGSIVFSAAADVQGGSITAWDWIYNSAIIGSNQQITVPAGAFAAGQNTILLRVTDNGGGVHSASIAFNIVPHSSPSCSISGPVLNPDPSAYYPFPLGQAINFAGSAVPADSCSVPSFQYIWRDNNVSIISNQLSFSRSNLSSGTHDITFYVTDGLGGECYDSMLINITHALNAPPTADITSPADGATFVEDCEAIPFSVNSNDSDGVIQNIMWYWGSNMIYSGQSFSRAASFFGIGAQQNVSVTVVDDDNAIGTDSVMFNVVDHASPSIMITSPISDPNPALYYSYPERFMLNFSAIATANDACVPGFFQYIWRDNANAIISASQSFSVNNLSVGTHNITVYATDGFGGEAYDTMLINITDVPNQPPMIDSMDCYNQFGGIILAEHDPIFCNATAHDTDGRISIWQWIIQGVLGHSYGQTLAIPYPYLAAGTYNISLTVFDNESAAAQMTIPITVIANNAPTVTITAPSANLSYTGMEFCAINFSSTASDSDGYIIPQLDPAYNWMVTMANGTTSHITSKPYFTYTGRLPVGLNTFTVSVSDDDGAQASDSMLINTTKNVPPAVSIMLPSPASDYIYIHNRSLVSSINFDAALTGGPADDCAACTPADYVWSWYDTFNSVTTTLANTRAFILNNPETGIHTITSQSTDCYGASGLDMITVNVTEVPNQPPVITEIECHDLATGSPALVEYQAIQCNATASDPDGNITMWLWDVDGDGVGQQVSLTHSTFILPALLGNGAYNVTLTVVDDGNPSMATTAVQQITVNNNAPVVMLTSIPNPAAGSEPLPLNFTCSIAAGTGNNPYTYNMSFGANMGTDILPNGASTRASFTTTYYQNGTYNATCYVKDMDGDIGAGSITVTVTDSVPDVDFTFVPQNPIENQTVQFADISTAYDMPIAWSWQFGDGSTSTAQNPTHRYLQNATYTVNLTITDNDGSSRSHTEDIVVEDTTPQNLIIIANPASPVIEGTNVSFIGFATAYDMPLTYEWDFDASNGITVDATGQIVNHLFRQNGNYIITLTVRDNDGSTASTIYMIVVIDTAPTANAGPDQTVSECTNVLFNGSLSIGYDQPLSYNWDFNDGIIGTGVTITHIYNTQGIYNVKLNVTDSDFSSALDTMRVNVLDTVPNTFFTYAPLNPSEGATIKFNSTGSSLNLCDGPNFNYAWNFGDGTVVSGIGMATASHSYNDQGNYLVTLTITDGDGSSDSYPLWISISDVNPFVTSLSHSSPSLEGSNVNFSASAMPGSASDLITNFSWNFGDGSLIEQGSALTNPIHAYGDNGTYIVTLTVSDEDSSVSNNTIVIVNNVAPTASAGRPYVCNPGGFVGPLAGTASDPAGINDPLTFAWDFDYTGTFTTDSTQQQPTLTCSIATGNYTMAFRVDDGDNGITTVFTSVNVTAGPINNAPQFVPPLGAVNTVNNTPFTYDANATDADIGQTRTYYADIVPINLNTGVISFTPTTIGTMNINVIVCDNSGFPNNCTSGFLSLNVVLACIDADGDGHNSTGGVCGIIDCNDANPAVHPGATETCNGVDDNCNGIADEGLTATAPLNPNQQGVCIGSTQICTGVGGWVDYYMGIANYQAGTETTCDNLDNNCNGATDEGLTTAYYRDLDMDNYGNPAVMQTSCSAPVGYVISNTDCNDANPAMNPSASEVCNGVDDDCSGVADDHLISPLNTNQNGVCAGSKRTCTGAGGWSDNYTGIAGWQLFETSCDGLDNNCNTQIDEGLLTTFYLDSDSDNYGNTSIAQNTCTASAGYIAVSNDCNDAIASIHPGAVEICGNGIDENCDGIDPSCTCGNSVVDSGEQCDDGNHINGDGCNAACRSEYCGDGIQQSLRGEQCDLGAANGATGSVCSELCTLQGYPLPTCGNGAVDPGEQCDGSIGSYSCSNFDSFNAGALSCSGCMLNTAACTGPSPPVVNGTCGDGMINPGEQCDGSIGAYTCASFGFTGSEGALSCNYCKFNTSSCTINAPIGQIINSTIYGGFYPNNMPSDVNQIPVSASTSMLNATIIGPPVVSSISGVNDLRYVVFTGVTAIENCVAIGTPKNPTILTNTACVNQYIDPSNITDSDTTGTSQIINSNITSSTATLDQLISNSAITDSVINNSWSKSSTVDISHVYDSYLDHAYVYNSTLRNCTLINSNITSGTCEDDSYINATINSTDVCGGIVNGVDLNGTCVKIPSVILNAPSSSYTGDNVGIGAQIQNNGTGNNTPPYSYLWDFGDNAGSSTSATNIISDSKEHVYSAAGSYNIKLRVINSYGVSATVHNLISVTDRPQVNPPSGGGGGNGHSSGGVVTGGGSSGSLLSDTYTCLGNRNIIVTPNDKMLINYKGTNYTLFVKDILTNSVLVKVYPIPSRNLQVTKGDSKSFDLDWNNMNDFTLNVYSTKPNLNANISCDIIPEKAAPVEKLKEEPKTIPEIINNIKEGILSIASEIVPKEKASPIVGSVLALAIIMIGLLSYSIYNRRKSRNDEFY